MILATVNDHILPIHSMPACDATAQLAVRVDNDGQPTAQDTHCRAGHDRPVGVLARSVGSNEAITFEPILGLDFLLESGGCWTDEELRLNGDMNNRYPSPARRDRAHRDDFAGTTRVIATTSMYRPQKQSCLQRLRSTTASTSQPRYRQTDAR